MTHHRYYLLALMGGAIALTIITWLCVISYAPLNAQLVPIHYNVIAGYDELGGRTDLYQLPLFSLLVLVVNIVVAWLFRGTGRFFALVSLIVACVVSALVLGGLLLLMVQT